MDRSCKTCKHMRNKINEIRVYCDVIDDVAKVESGCYSYSPKEKDRIEIHKGICKRLNETYKAKNTDYGDSFKKVRDKYPKSILIRLNDKLNRLETLINGQARQVKDESIEDTLLDLANYSLMELVERKIKK